MHRFIRSATITSIRTEKARSISSAPRCLSTQQRPGATNNYQHHPKYPSWGHNTTHQPSTVSIRYFSSSNINNNNVKDLPVKILYASQGGTAQIFAMQLAEALEDAPGGDEREVTVHGLHEGPPESMVTSLDPAAMHVFLTATAGVGEPPDNAKKFYKWLMAKNDKQLLDGVDYTVFGLGNQKAHPNHFNVMGKTLDAQLDALGAKRAYPLGLGDDGECIEDDYDTWMNGFVQAVYHENAGAASDEAVSEEQSETADEPATSAEVEDPNTIAETCAGAKDESGKRLISTKYARLQLTPSETDVVRDNVLHLSEVVEGSAFYNPETQSLPVLSNRPLNPQAGENGLFEMRVSLANTKDKKMTYETGDHLMVYPQNSQAMVEGFLQNFDVDPHAIIDPPETPGRQPYPHPTGITLTETLRHCVDLSGVPSPGFARHLLGRAKIDYKNDIAMPHRTVLDLMAESGRSFALEEILYNLPPMKARYYSIASSSLVHPEEIYLVYRPVQYTSSRGNLHSGVSTSFMKNMMGAEDSALDDYNTVENISSNLIATVNSNPTFRLPVDEQTPVLFVAGGCGVAPIRAFLEERIHVTMEHSHNPYGEGYLFLGFRSPGDAPYKALVEQAFRCGAISNVHLTYSSGCGTGVSTKLFGEDGLQAHTSCGLVSDAVGEHGEQLYSFFDRGGHTYICGGARMFGVAIENQVHLLLQNYGNLSENEATNYLQRLLEEGRFNEDLSD